MTNFTKHFVTNQNIPEFVKTDHELFETFVKAYYEWLELQNDSENSSYADVYKAVGNPAWLNNNQSTLVDIDDTVDEFIEFFANEVVPISLTGIQTNPRFFLKHIRDLYLAKGTIQSFKLFFKLYYNDDIEVYETRDNVLRASDGKYYSFPTAHFYVTDFEKQVQFIDFTLATITDDSDNLIGTILDGSIIGNTPNKETIVKAQFSSDVTLKANTPYFIKSSDGLYKIKVQAFVSISEIKLVETAPLYDENDPIFIESKDLKRIFLGSVTSVTSGSVNGIKVRDKGILYSNNDYFEFENENNIRGRFDVTKVSRNGEILEVDNISLRSGSTNNGFLANTLVDVYVPISNGGSTWKQLPKIKYTSSTTTLNIANPYPQTITTSGVGFQSIPLSSDIGRARNISINQETYFKDSDDVLINVPANIIIENNTLKVGDKIAFQTFGKLANFGPFLDDSDTVTMRYSFFRLYETPAQTPYVYKDSEVVRKDNITIVYGFDSDKFEWKTRNVVLDTSKSNSNIFKPITDLFDSEDNISYKVTYVFGDTDIVDGGSTFDTTGDSEVGGFIGYDRDSENNEIVDGGPTFGFAGSAYGYIDVEFSGNSLNKLEAKHFNQLNDLIGMDSDRNLFEWSTSKGEPNLNIDDSDMGEWIDTGHYGKVVGVSHNNQVIKVVEYDGHNLPTQTTIDKLNEEKYSIVKVSPLNEFGVSIKDYSLPLSNVVHQIDRMRVEYKTSIVSNIFSKFYSQDGFLSSDIMYLCDNYYYSDWSYRIKSKLPLDDWKQKFKTLLHPAGMVMTSTYVVNMESNRELAPKTDSKYPDLTPRMTFDQNQEYIDLISAASTNADNIYYKSNGFEVANTITGKAKQLDASSQTSIFGLTKKQQNGNAWWDYEPIGWVKSNTIQVVGDSVLNLDSDVYFTNRFSTQDSDGSGFVKNTYTYYKMFDESRQNFYKNDSRFASYLRNNYMISKVQFEDANLVKYSVYDSDLPDDFIVTFVDSDEIFKKINYDRLKSDSDNRYFPEYYIPRTAEIAGSKEKDLRLAMRENKSLVWDDSDKIYYDYDAYERKWNQINNKRTRNTEGYLIKGNNVYIGYEHVEMRSKKRNKDFVDLDNREYSSKNVPLSVDVWKNNTIVWDNHYYDKINTTYINPRYEKETFKDPQVSMRGRRGR